MLSTLLLLAILELFGIAAASPVLNNAVSIPSAGLHKYTDIIQRDKEVQATRIWSRNDPVVQSVFSTNGNDFPLVLSVTLGGKKNDMLVDTGSALTWIKQQYIRGGPGTATMHTGMIEYIGGTSVLGPEYTNSMSLAPNLVAPKQSFCFPKFTDSLPGGADGILGLAPYRTSIFDFPADLDMQNKIGYYEKTIEDNLWDAGSLLKYVFALYFHPVNPTPGTAQNNAEITFGGSRNPSPATRPPTTIAKSGTYPTSLFWGIDLKLAYGTAESQTPLLTIPPGAQSAADQTLQPVLACPIDTGAGRVLFTKAVLDKYLELTGATRNSDQQSSDSGSSSSSSSSTGTTAAGVDRGVSIKRSLYLKLQSLFFIINGESFELTRDAQAKPGDPVQSMQDDDIIPLAIASFPDDKAGRDCLLGWPFLQRFYVEIDVANNAISLAPTSDTDSTANRGVLQS